MALNLPNRTQTNTTTTTTADAAQNPKDRPPAEYWLNVGYYDTIDGEEVFVGLTLGIPLDQLKPMKGSSSLAKRKNHLNEIALAAAMELEPGTSMPVQELSVEIRRVGEQEQLAPEDTTLTRLTFGRRAA